ncbi:MAG: MerR family transcriptional regulator [Victivallaceae bacterium]|nr:MerR family transcriptional regulator [Victivallaceae bacterium]
MNLEKEFYTVSELGDEVGAPRTTINDYLGRYPEYIESTVRGKRRVYPVAAVAVLKEIYQLRSAGHSFAEIEQHLAAHFPLHPEVNNRETEAIMDNADNEKQQLVSVDDIRAIGQYIAKSEEVRREEASRNYRRMLWPLVLLLLLVIIAASGGALAAAKLMQAVKAGDGKAETQAAQLSLEIKQSAAGQEQRLLGAVREEMAATAAERDQKLDQLAFKLEDQAQKQKNEIATLRSEMTAQRNAELKALREEMTAKNAKQLEAAAAEASAKQIALDKAAKAAAAKSAAELSAMRDKVRAIEVEKAAIASDRQALQLRVAELENKLADTEKALSAAKDSLTAAASMVEDLQKPAPAPAPAAPAPAAPAAPTSPVPAAQK